MYYQENPGENKPPIIFNKSEKMTQCQSMNDVFASYFMIIGKGKRITEIDGFPVEKQGQGNNQTYQDIKPCPGF